MQGFDVGDRTVLDPPVQIEPDTRDLLVRVMMAVATGATPEEISDWVQDGFPAEITVALEKPLETVEMSAHVDVFLAAMQSSTARAAA